MDPNAGEAELARLPALLVYLLRIVVEDEQGIGLLVDHLHDEAQPFRFEIVSLVDEDGRILRPRNRIVLHAVHDGLHERVEIVRRVGFGPRYGIRVQLLCTPAMEVLDRNLVMNAMGLDDLFEPCRQRLVEAKNEDRLGILLRKRKASIAEDHRLAGAGDAVYHAMPITE